MSLAFSCCASFNIFSISSNLWVSNPEALGGGGNPRQLIVMPVPKQITQLSKLQFTCNDKWKTEQTPEGGGNGTDGVSPFRGACRVAGGDAGLQAVWALQAQGVIRLIAARGTLMMQDRVMYCGRRLCARGKWADSCQRSIALSTDRVKTIATQK